MGQEGVHNTQSRAPDSGNFAFIASVDLSAAFFVIV